SVPIELPFSAAKRSGLLFEPFGMLAVLSTW
ncbi:unnamed protein product, partial [marine sediment metagenome]